MKDTGHQHAVEGGVIRHLSATQLKTFEACERSWYFEKVLHLPKPQFKAQQVGVEVHAQLEHYAKTGEDVLGDIARPVLPFLPAPGAGLLVEEPIAGVVTAAGIPVVGFIDLVNPRRLADDGVVRVTDYKTSSDIAKYAARPEDLERATGAGIQMITYAIWVLRQFGGVGMVELEHIYAQTKGKKAAAVVRTEVLPGQVLREAKRIDALAERMKSVAAAKSLGEVKPNWNACEAYGGCPFQAQCLTYQTRERRTMGVMDLLKKSTANATPAPLPEVPAPVATPQPVEVVKAEAVIEETPVEAPAPVEEKPKRTRKAKAPEPSPDEDFPQEMIDRTVARLEASAAPVLRVFVDCIPNEKVESLSSYVATIIGDIATTYDVVDIRCAPARDANGKDHPLAFGKWKGVLSGCIRAQPPKPGTYAVLVGGSELMQVATEALEALCAPGNYVRAVR